MAFMHPKQEMTKGLLVSGAQKEVTWVWGEAERIFLKTIKGFIHRRLTYCLTGLKRVNVSSLTSPKLDTFTLLKRACRTPFHTERGSVWSQERSQTIAFGEEIR